MRTARRHHRATTPGLRQECVSLRRRGGNADRGATAVEFALLLPLLLLIVFGVVDFGRALNAKITLTQAAREGAGLAAVGKSNADVTSRAQAASTGLTGVTVAVNATCPANSTPGTDASVSTTYTFEFVT